MLNGKCSYMFINVPHAEFSIMIFTLPHFITLLLESVGGDSSSGRVMRIAMYYLSKWSSSQGLQHEAAEVSAHCAAARVQ
jgi:hypothetical protein